MQILRERWRRRDDEDAEPAVEVLRRLGDEVAIPPHDLGGLVNRPEGRPADHRADRMQPEEERRDDAEVAASTPDRPKEIRMLVGVGRDKAAIGQDDVHGQQVVDGQAIFARQVTQAATKGKAADAGGGDEAARCRHSEGVGGVVDLAPGAAALDAHGPRFRIDANALHLREVDHQPGVAGAEAGAVVAAPADSEEQVVLAGEGDGGDHVGDVGATGDHCGTLVDHAVVDRADRFIVRIARQDQVAAKVGGKLADLLRRDSRCSLNRLC